MKRLMVIAGIALGLVQGVSAQAVIPGWLTDPTAMKGALGNDASYQPPEAFKYPYVSTYYVKPTVTPDEVVKVSAYVTDFEHSKIRFLDDSHRFTVYLEYRVRGGQSKVLTLKDRKSGDVEFVLGKLPVGDYELRVWAKDAKGRESHRVIHDFRVRTAAELAIPADKVYTMTAADLAAYGIRNDGDLEKVVYVESNGAERTVKEKRADVPGYTVTVPLDPKTGKLPYRAFAQAKVVYDEGYDHGLVESNAVLNVKGIQKLIDEKAAAGFRKLTMLPGVYRVSHVAPIMIPDNFTWDLGKATIKLNQFFGEKCMMVRMASAIDAHVTGGVIEGDYWAHDYTSPKDSEWVNGFQISGDSWYCSFDGVTVKEIAGYGGSNYIESDHRGALAFFCEALPKYAAGGLDRKTGEVDATDSYRFTSDFFSLHKIVEKLGRRRLQLSKYLGYQGVRTRSWQVTVCWYDAEKRFLSSETAWQFRETWIPEGAAFMRVSVEAGSLEEACPKSYTEALQVTAFRYPINCAIRNCRFERCRCVGYAAAQMKNWIFEGNFFTESGEAEAKCAFDAEDGADQMQDAYFLRNKFRDNPVNNSILTCAGHNFILEQNDGGIHFWGRTHSPCVRGNDIEQATYYCDSRIRSGYGRFDGNRYTKGIKLGVNEMKVRPDNWDEVLSGETFDGAKDSFSIDVGRAGRIVGCTFRDMKAVGVASAFACNFVNCKGWCTGTRWIECTVRDSQFKNFFGTNSWDRCHFKNSKIENVNKGTLVVKNSDFVGSEFIGLSQSTLAVKDCKFDDTSFDGGWWANPAKLLFRNCTFKAPEKGAIFSVGAYNIGSFSFNDCTVTGKRPFMHVKDMRPLKFFQGENPDLKTGTVAFKGMKWKSESNSVVTHGTGAHEELSSKPIVFDGSASVWPGNVKVVTDLFPSWTAK